MLQSHSWKQSGSVSLWRYTENLRNYPGWHLTADAVGCASVVTLLDALESDNSAVSRTIALVPPTPAVLAVPNNRSSAVIAPEKLRMSFSLAPSQWSFTESAAPAELTFGSNWLPQLRRAIAGISRGEGDYSIGESGGGNLPLWFWWQPVAA
jgi:hypothetical protein